MKSFITSLIIAAVVIGSSLFYVHHISGISEEMIEENEKVIQSLETEDFDGALKGLNKLTERMDDKRTILAATGNHEELDKIEIYMLEARQYSEENCREDALARCRVLEMLFEHLPKNYRIRLENIL